MSWEFGENSNNKENRVRLGHLEFGAYLELGYQFGVRSFKRIFLLLQTLNPELQTIIGG